VSGAEAARLLRERADSYARDAETLRGADPDAVAILTAMRFELRRVADEVEALPWDRPNPQPLRDVAREVARAYAEGQNLPPHQVRCDQCGGLPGRCTDPGGRYWGDCYNPHDCTKSADHTFDRGFFCKVCDRQMLQAEFS
jgi:hypothetical protein